MTIKTIKYEMTEVQKVELISNFHAWYYNTNQDVEEFSAEFYYVVSDILQDEVPIELEHLTEYTDILIKVLPDLADRLTGREDE